MKHEKQKAIEAGAQESKKNIQRQKVQEKEWKAQSFCLSPICR